MTDFEYILFGCEVDEYCYLLLDKYGEESDVVKVLDGNYDDLTRSSHVFTEKLNAIRRFLYNNGYERQVEYADSVFIPRLEKRFCEVSKYCGLTNLDLRQKIKEKHKE